MKRFLKLKIAIVVALVICCITNINAFSKHCDSIRDKMLRMHVIANSDSKDDQQLKLKVRDAVLCKGKEIFDGSITANEAKSKITPYIDMLEKTAMEVVINEGYDYLVISNILELKLLEYLGIMPVIDRCVSCGSKNEIITISSYKGGYLCKKCLGEDIIVDIKTIKLVRMFYLVDIDKISKLDVSVKSKEEISRFIDDYYDRYSGLYLKTKEFLKNLKNI